MQEGIEWWGWVLIWLVLVLALVAMLALFAWRLFRKSLGLLDDLSDLTDQVTVLGDAEHEPRLPPTTLAVLSEVQDIRTREEARVARRRLRRDERRERRMSRAIAIGSVRISETQWPEAWYGRRRARNSKP